MLKKKLKFTESSSSVKRKGSSKPHHSKTRVEQDKYSENLCRDISPYKNNIKYTKKR